MKNSKPAMWEDALIDAAEAAPCTCHRQQTHVHPSGVDLRPKPWTPKTPPPHLVFTNANVIDVEKGAVIPNATVELRGGEIVAVRSASSWFSNPSSTTTTARIETSASTPTTPTTIDLAGRFLCPGLIDCHVHLTSVPGADRIADMFAAHPNTIAYRTAYTARAMLRRGFTTARDTGGADAALKQAIDECLVPGPRLFIAGKALSQTGGHGDFRPAWEDTAPPPGQECCGGHHPALGRVCDGEAACLAAARDELRKGADFIKIMGGGGVASPTDALGMLQFTPPEIRAIVAAAESVGTYVTAHAYTVAAIRQCVDAGVRGIEHANFIDDATAKLCAKLGVFVTPTLVAYDTMGRPPFDAFLPESGRAKNKEVLAAGLGSLATCARAGVTLCYGSDLLAGMQPLQSREFGIRAGVLSAVEVLRSATVNGAARLGCVGKLGVVREGAWADVLVLERNPLVDVAVLDEMEGVCAAVVKSGRVVTSQIEGLAVDEVYRGV